MKKVFILLALLLLAIPVVAAEECDKPRDLVSDNLEARYKFMLFRAEIRSISMDAVIDRFQEEGIDTSELEAIHEDFLALYDRAEAEASDGDVMGFNDVVRDGVDLVAEFRDTARAEEVTGVLEAIKAALEEKKDYLDGLHSDAIDAKIDNYLRVFDARICHHQVIIDRWAEKDADVSELQDDLDAIEAKKDDLVDKIEAAEEACEKPYILCTEPEADDLRDLHREINDDFRNLNIKFRDVLAKGLVQAAITLQQKNIEFHTNIVATMSRNGKDMGDVESDLDEAETHNSEAQESLDNSDIEGAKEHFELAKNSMDNVRRGIQEARG